MSEKPEFFKTPAAFRKWLQKNHDKVDVQWVGYYKVATGKASITWDESVDVALCFGWIDGLRRSIDDEAYKIRFTPRRAGSVWSAKNIAAAERLIVDGLMEPPGRAAFDQRREDKSSIYSDEQREKLALGSDLEQLFRSNKAAWKWYRAQAPGYRKKTAHWVMAAKKEETRRRRLQQLIDHSEAESVIPPLARKKK